MLEDVFIIRCMKNLKKMENEIIKKLKDREYSLKYLYDKFGVLFVDEKAKDLFFEKLKEEWDYV